MSGAGDAHRRGAGNATATRERDAASHPTAREPRTLPDAPDTPTSQEGRPRMADTDDSTRDDETPQEQEEARETGETPDEAHRQGEYEALGRKLDEVLARLNGLSSLIADKQLNEPAPVNEPEAPGLKNLDDIEF